MKDITKEMGFEVKCRKCGNENIITDFYMDNKDASIGIMWVGDTLLMVCETCNNESILN